MIKKILPALRIIFFLGLGIAVIFLFYGNLGEEAKQSFWQSLGKAKFGWLFASFIIAAVAHYVRALRWGLLLEPFNFRPKKSNLFFAVMNMYFANMLIPRLGEVTRCAVLRKYEKIPFEKSLGTVVAERAVDMILLLIAFGITMIFQFSNWEMLMQNLSADAQPTVPSNSHGFWASNWKWMVIVFILCLLAALFFLRKKPFLSKIYSKTKKMAAGFWHGIKSIAKIKQKGTFIFHSLLIWVLYFSMTYAAFFSLDATTTYNLVQPLSVLVFGSVAIIFVPGGIGAFPLIVSATLLIYGVDKGVGYALGWILWSVQSLLVLLLGAVSLVLLPIVNKKSNEPVKTMRTTAEEI